MRRLRRADIGRPQGAAGRGCGQPTHWPRRYRRGWLGHRAQRVRSRPHTESDGGCAGKARRARKRPTATLSWSLPNCAFRLRQSQAGAETAAAIPGADFRAGSRCARCRRGPHRRPAPDLAGGPRVRAQSDALAPVVRVDLNFQRLALFGLSASDVLDTIQAAFAGETVARHLSCQPSRRPGDQRPADAATGSEGVGDLLVRSTSGISVPLKAVANVYLTDGHALIDHDGGFRRQVVTAAPTDAVGFAARARRAIADKIVLPTGAFIESAGRGKRRRPRATISSSITVSRSSASSPCWPSPSTPGPAP